MYQTRLVKVDLSLRVPLALSRHSPRRSTFNLSLLHQAIFSFLFFFFQPILPVRNSFSQEKEKEGFRVKSCRERFLACERVLRNPMMRLFARSRVIFTTRKGVGWNYRSINSKYVRSWNGWVTVPPCVSREKSCIMTTCNTCPRFNKILFTGRKEGRKEKSSFF